ncbi:MAG: CHAT domain-containing protein, partial [Cyanobacteria bacterium P01_D01_bin.2]
VSGGEGEQAGGQVVIWSDGNTQFRGSISAQGDRAGGRVEVSGKEQLYFGGRVDVRSQGTPGTVLLDPENIEIRAGRNLGGSASEPYVLYEDTLENAITGNVSLVLQADNDITIAPLSDGALTFAQGTGRISFLADGDGDGQGSFTMAATDRLRAPGREIEITAANITAGSLDTSVFSVINNREDAGEIRLTATQGSITTSSVTSSARSTLNNSGNGGDIYLSAIDSVTVGDITTTASALNNRGDAGNITLTTQTGEITASGFDASTTGDNSNTGAGGTISLDSAQGLATGEITTSTGAIINNSGPAGGISLTSLTGNITTDSILAVTSAGQNNTGSGGNISLTAAQGAIATQQILSSTVSPNPAPNQGGDILLAASDDITVGFINATGQDQGGNITVTTQQTFRAVDNIPTVDAQTSLLTTDGGAIHITYNSGPTLPFAVGDSAVNGTAGSITTGLDSLTAPQTVIQPVGLSTIELNNLFDPPSLPSSPVSQPTTSPQASSLSHPVVLDVSPTVSTPPDSLGLFKFDTLGGVNNDEHGTSDDTSGERVSTTDRGELIWAQIETAFSTEFAKTLDLPVPPSPSLQTTQRTLRQVGHTQNINPALMYVRLQDTHVEIVLVDGEGAPVYRPVAATAAEVRSLVETFHRTVTNPVLRSHQYLPAAQQLYDWLVRPVAEELQAADIDHIGFVLDAGLRSLPMAALHDGEQFLIERYSIGLLPSLGLTDMGPGLSASEQEVTLAMGIANFEQHANLAAVPFELELASQTRGDEQYLDHNATLTTLEQRLGTGSFSTVHLATHAVFQPGNFDASYVQLWERTINLHQVK